MIVPNIKGFNYRNKTASIGASLVCEDDNLWEVKLWSLRNDVMGNGNGYKLLKKAVNYLKTVEGLSIVTLTAGASPDSRYNTKQLISMYKSVGFKVNKEQPYKDQFDMKLLIN